MPDLDSITVLYVADANDTTMALVQLGDVPDDGTWEVLSGSDAGIGWVPLTDNHPLIEAMRADGQSWSPVLVVARPIGSDNG